MTIHLPEDLETSLREEVGRGHFSSVDEAIAEAVRSFLGGRRNGTPGGLPVESAFDVLDRTGLIGCIDGLPDSPDDLSTNPGHMEGFGLG